MEQKTEKKLRECGMMTCIGFQGVGKTYQNMQVISDYVKDKIKTGVKGRKCLIVDSNGEYGQEQFTKNGVPNFNPKRIALSDVEAWCKTDISECRRIDAKNVGIKEKKAILEYLVRYARNLLLTIEDINSYILSMTHMEEIVGGLVNLRHRGVDVFISYLRLRAVEPLIYSNSRWIRLHFSSGRMEDVMSKINNFELYKIAQLIVNNKYSSGDKRFFLYISNIDNSIKGKFTKADFSHACKQYLSIYKKPLKEYEQMNDCSKEEAIDGKTKQYIEDYYGNN